jgi:hypothetical protein
LDTMGIGRVEVNQKYGLAKTVANVISDGRY